MKELANIIDAYKKLKNSTAKLALVTVIDVEGSSYRRTGARMLIQDNGIYTGGISGGCIEGNALKKAFLTISSNKARLVTYDTSKEDEAQIGVSLGCKGVIKVLITPVNTSDPHNPVEQLINCAAGREPNIIITVLEVNDDANIEVGQVYKFTTEAELQNDFGTTYEHPMFVDIQNLLATGKSMIKTYSGGKFFLEFVPPSLQIIIMGDNYDIYPLLNITENLGWQSVVVANKRRLDGDINQLANCVVADFKDVAVDKFTVAVIMSHDYNADLNNLRQALNSKLQYIGLLGPASRKKEMLAELSADFEQGFEARIYGPAGLDIGASQPEEIAIAIVAEILSVMRNRPGKSLRDRRGPIYDR